MEKSKNTDDGGLEFTQIAYFYNKKVTTANKKFNNHLKKEEPKKRRTKKKISSAEEDTFKIQNSISSSPISLLKELVYETNKREPMQSYTLMCLFAEFFTFFEETKEVNEYVSQYINYKNCDFNEDVISGIHKIYNTDITANRYHLSWLVKMVIRTKNRGCELSQQLLKMFAAFNL
jgi:ribosomal protein S18